ncbi:MAG: zinc-ribbon domain-containing protein, partial [Desulfuromusa sp.]|nr:zinc-ribbon domain-containing protein [Desulfuromusa sp.]
MIIVCPECSTKFNVDSERIPDKGTKVRCARCKHVFLVEKPLEQKAPILEEMESFQEEQATEEADFSYDKFQELDSSAKEEETFTFGAEADTEDESFFSDNREEATTPANT